MDAQELARRFALGDAASLSDGTVARGKPATDWLHPNPRSPDRADSAAWIGDVLNEPHTRELLDSLLRSAN